MFGILCKSCVKGINESKFGKYNRSIFVGILLFCLEALIAFRTVIIQEHVYWYISLHILLYGSFTARITVV
jgi:hypothetical protein